MNDIEYIYNKLCNKHNLLLTNSFALNAGFTIDVPVISGKSELGEFLLYVDEDTKEPHGGMFVFCVEYEKRTWFRKRLVKRAAHWHPQNIEDAIKYVDEFMLNKLKF